VEDFYAILGIDKSAGADAIRAAYKKMAMQYHPDRNPDNPQAEETFKQVNEAYHVLSDPLKKARYDARFFQKEDGPSESWQQEMRRRRYYHWQQAQQKRYTFDKNYFRIQGLSFLVFIVLSGFCFAIMHTVNYLGEQEQLKRLRANTHSLKQINALFSAGRFDDAFILMQRASKSDPMEFRFIIARDSLVSELRNLADGYFTRQEFAPAVAHYTILKNYENPATFETISRISLCQYYLGNYPEALQAMKHLHLQQPRNLELVYRIGLINLEKLENYQEASQYFTLGKKIFKENLTSIYGEAFELMMNPADAPDIYYDIFRGRAITNIQLKNHDEAIKDCNWAIYLRPYKSEGYRLRAQARLKAGKRQDVCEDLFQAQKRQDPEAGELIRKYCRE